MNGQPTVFDLEGLRGSNFVMRDRLTKSDWQQATGEAFAGPNIGKRLELIPFTITTWGEWRVRYPRTLALVVAPPLDEEYRLMSQRQRELMAFPLAARDPLHEDARLRPTVMVAGVEAGGGVKAYPLSALSEKAVLNDRVGTTPVVFFYTKSTGTNRAFTRVSSGLTLTFQPSVGGSVDFTDRETGSRWNQYGECVAGKLKGSRLKEILLQPSFWFSWAAFHPKTEVYLSKQR